MNLSVAIGGPSGDTELEFRDGSVRVKWGKANGQERMMIADLIRRGKKAGLKALLVDGDGEPDEPEEPKSPGATTEIRTVAGELAKEGGELILSGDTDGVRLVAKDLVESEIRRGRLVLRAQKDGTWKTLKAEDGFEPKEEKDAVASSPKVVGG